jgi:SAM-dependent methyltransferase
MFRRRAGRCSGAPARYARFVLRRLADRVSLRSRRRKFELFVETLRPGPETSVLDVGVTDAPFGERPDNFLEAWYPWPERITAVGLTPLERFGEAFPAVTTVQADGRALPFPDGAFDVGFSNAVVEHVGDREAQRAFVHELCRVTRRVFLTTPNRWFPLEVHTLIPFAHWLPRGLRERVLRTRGWTETLELLAPAEVRSLFPGDVRILRRGMTIVAVGEGR